MIKEEFFLNENEENHGEKKFERKKNKPRRVKKGEKKVAKNCHKHVSCCSMSHYIRMSQWIWVCSEMTKHQNVWMEWGQDTGLTGPAFFLLVVYTVFVVFPQKIASRPPSAVSTSSRPGSSRSGPSSELLDILETLGRISDGHNELKKRVDVLEVMSSIIIIHCLNHMYGHCLHIQKGFSCYGICGFCCVCVWIEHVLFAALLSAHLKATLKIPVCEPTL